MQKLLSVAVGEMGRSGAVTGLALFFIFFPHSTSYMLKHTSGVVSDPRDGGKGM